MIWLLWAAFLLVQNYCFTWVSRARNGDSLREHVKAALGSNGVWFLGQVVSVNIIVEAYNSHAWTRLTAALLWYTTWTMVGSIYAHYVLLRKKRNQPGTSVLGVLRGIAHELFFAVPTPTTAKASPSN